MVHVKHQAGVWSKLIELLRGQKFWMDEIAAGFDITPQMAHALHELRPTESRTMKELASELWCDASNVTGIIDRLEAKGLVERRPAQHDRRVKCVLLTPAGRRIRKRLEERMNEAPPAVAALSLADQAELGAILDRALLNAQAQRAERSAAHP